MIDTTTQRRFDEMVTLCRLYEMTPEQRELANILIRNCRNDLLRWPGLAADIIEDTRRAIEGMRVEA